jgi:hypothetical protein
LQAEVSEATHQQIAVEMSEARRRETTEAKRQAESLSRPPDLINNEDSETG